MQIFVLNFFWKEQIYKNIKRKKYHAVTKSEFEIVSNILDLWHHVPDVPTILSYANRKMKWKLVCRLTLA